MRLGSQARVIVGLDTRAMRLSAADVISSRPDQTKSSALPAAASDDSTRTEGPLANWIHAITPSGRSGLGRASGWHIAARP